MHHGKAGFALIALAAAAGVLMRRPFVKRAAIVASRCAEALMAVAANHAPAPATGGNPTLELPAAGSSFYLAMRILPRERRQADVRDLCLLPRGR